MRKVAAAREVGASLEAAVGTSAVVERAGAVDEIVSVAGDSATFARRQVLGVLEAEASEVADRSAFLSLVVREPGLTGVLDDRETVLPGDGHDRVHVARHPVDMHRHDGARAFRDSTLDGSRVHRQGGRIGVGKNRQRLVKKNRVVAGVERERRDDDLVAGVHVKHVHADDERRRSAGGGQAALGSEQFRIRRLES